MPEISAENHVSELKRRSEREPVAEFLGAKLVELSPGYARVTMKVRPEFLNFNGLVFGGIIMSLADQAFAYASNSLSFPSYASQLNIHFIAGVEVGEEITATCHVVKSGRRVGISEISVTDPGGKLIARATGTTIPLNETK